MVLSAPLTRSGIFSLANGCAAQEGLQRRLLVAPPALVWPLVVVRAEPRIEVCLQLRERGVELLAERYSVELVQLRLVRSARRFRSSAGDSSSSGCDRCSPPVGTARTFGGPAARRTPSPDPSARGIRGSRA